MKASRKFLSKFLLNFNRSCFVPFEVIFKLSQNFSLKFTRTDQCFWNVYLSSIMAATFTIKNTLTGVVITAFVVSLFAVVLCHFLVRREEPISGKRQSRFYHLNDLSISCNFQWSCWSMDPTVKCPTLIQCQSVWCQWDAKTWGNVMELWRSRQSSQQIIQTIRWTFRLNSINSANME